MSVDKENTIPGLIWQLMLEQMRKINNCTECGKPTQGSCCEACFLANEDRIDKENAKYLEDEERDKL